MGVSPFPIRYAHTIRFYPYLNVDLIMESINFISQYIAPWALSKEEVPLHLMWGPSCEYDLIRIEIPSDTHIKEFFNVEECVNKDSHYIIEKLKSPNYFGFTIATINIINNQHEVKKILIDFLKDGEMIYQKSFNANIYRPYLQIEDVSNSVVITDETYLDSVLNMKLKLTGFGQIIIRNETSSGGKFIERAEPLYRELFRKMITTFESEEVEFDAREIKINPLYLQNKTKEFIENIEKGIIPFDIEREELDEFTKWTLDESNKDKIEELVSKHMEDLIIDSILYYFEKNPEDNIQIPQGEPTIVIEKAIKEVRIKLIYSDSLKNEYEPVETTISIEDKRINSTPMLELPINLDFIIEVINPLEVCE